MGSSNLIGLGCMDLCQAGVHYGGEGVALEDQPLLAAIRVLIGRPFGVPDGLQ